MDPVAVIMVVGTILTLAGIGLIIFKEPTPEVNVVRFFGLELTLSTPFLAVTALGVILLLSPLAFDQDEPPITTPTEGEEEPIATTTDSPTVEPPGAEPPTIVGPPTVEPPFILVTDEPADRTDVCRLYANVAVEQGRRNSDENCEFTGWGFNDGYDSHFDWCMQGQDDATLVAHWMARLLTLQGCNRTDAFCADYADRAVGQFNEGFGRQCGFDLDGDWHPFVNIHFGWCVEVTRPEAERKKAMRSDRLAECSGQ